jgi:hypothetical protein
VLAEEPLGALIGAELRAGLGELALRTVKPNHKCRIIVGRTNKSILVL